MRKGEVVITKPSILLPPNIPQFEGFEFEEEAQCDQRDVTNFLLVRGVTLPSLKYNNKIFSLDMFEGKLSEAVKHHRNQLERKEDVQTGLIVGPDDCWQFSVLIFMCTQVTRNAEG